MFDHFYLNVMLLKSLMSFFVTFILKVECPLELGDFRFMSILGSLYKLVVKVLVVRLDGVMG